MTILQLLVIGVGLVAGHWLVSRLFPGDRGPERVSAPPPARKRSARPTRTCSARIIPTRWRALELAERGFSGDPMS